MPCKMKLYGYAISKKRKKSIIAMKRIRAKNLKEAIKKARKITSKTQTVKDVYPLPK